MEKDALKYGVKFKTNNSLIAMQNWLEDNCGKKWSLAIIDIDDDIDQKEVKLLFADETDKSKFVAYYTGGS